MHKILRRAVVAVIAAGLATGLPAAHAGGAFTLKGGTMKLWDNSQDLDQSLRTLDDDSNRSFGFSYESRIHDNLGLGVEYLNYRYDFTPPDTAPGLAHAQTVQFVAHKYFSLSELLHPFLGFGFGFSQTTVSYDIPTKSYDNYEFNLAL